LGISIKIVMLLRKMSGKTWQTAAWWLIRFSCLHQPCSNVTTRVRQPWRVTQLASFGSESLSSAYALLNVKLVYHSVPSEKHVLSLTSDSSSMWPSFHFISASRAV